MLEKATAEQVRKLVVESHALEAEVMRAILGHMLTQGHQVVGAKEILDLAEGFPWTTNPAEGRG